jgi:hypothetical protein
VKPARPVESVGLRSASTIARFCMEASNSLISLSSASLCLPAISRERPTASSRRSRSVRNAGLSKHLEQSKFCIIALTRESLNSNWIMFEAGAISRSVEKALICTILFGIEATDLQGPLASFQFTKFTREEIYKLVQTINSKLEKPIIQNALDKTFEKMWPDLEQIVTKIIREAGSSP